MEKSTAYELINKEKNQNEEVSKDFNTSKILLDPSIDNKKTKTLDVTFGPVNRNNYNNLKQLNNMTLPVRYQDGFYIKIFYGHRFGRFAYFNDIIVGAISWKYDTFDGINSIYLMTISVLDEYRRYNIGSKLLQEVIRIHKECKEIEYINLHVQISNQVALRFYEKNQFTRVKLVENYYTGTEINPKDAYYLKYNLHN